jgi:hypothetical protein
MMFQQQQKKMENKPLTPWPQSPLTPTNRKQTMKRLLTIAVLIAMAVGLAQAEPRDRREHRNYILRRQQAYQVQGVPTSRLIIGKRQIDIYRNGMMFEGDNLVGIRSR